MRFDASPAAQQVVQKTVAVDPRMVRCGMVKLGSSLREICDVKGRVEWKRGGTSNTLAERLHEGAGHR